MSIFTHKSQSTLTTPRRLETHPTVHGVGRGHGLALVPDPAAGTTCTPTLVPVTLKTVPEEVLPLIPARTAIA